MAWFVTALHMAQRIGTKTKAHPKATTTRDSRITCMSRDILYENKQWAFTDSGIEHIGNWAYHIPKSTLLQGRSEDLGQAYQQPIHVGCKSEVDIRLFIDVYYRAIVLHGCEADIDGLAMLRTFAAVVKIQHAEWDYELRRQTGRLTREERGLDD